MPRRFTSIAASLLVLLGFVWPRPVAAESRVRVALLPPVVRAFEGRQALQRGLSDMLVSRLARDTRLAVVPVDDPAAATDQIDTARATGRAEDAEFVVYGVLTHFGAGASLELFYAGVADEAAPRRILLHAESMAALMPRLDGATERTARGILGEAPDASAVASEPPATPEPAAPAGDRRPAPGTEGTTARPDQRRVPGLPSDSAAGDVR